MNPVTLDPDRPFKRDPLAVHLNAGSSDTVEREYGGGPGDEGVCKVHVRMSESSPYTPKLEEDFNCAYQS